MHGTSQRQTGMKRGSFKMKTIGNAMNGLISVKTTALMVYWNV